MYFVMATIAPSAGIPYRNEMMSILAGEAFAYQMNPEHLKKLETLMKITKDEKLKKELEDTLKTNPDDVQEHIVEK